MQLPSLESPEAEAGKNKDMSPWGGGDKFTSAWPQGIPRPVTSSCAAFYAVEDPAWTLELAKRLSSKKKPELPEKPAGSAARRGWEGKKKRYGKKKREGKRNMQANAMQGAIQADALDLMAFEAMQANAMQEAIQANALDLMAEGARLGGDGC